MANNEWTIVTDSGLLSQWKPLNVITLMHAQTDIINQMKTIAINLVDLISLLE
jgi:hypothetical protein